MAAVVTMAKHLHESPATLARVPTLALVCYHISHCQLHNNRHCMCVCCWLIDRWWHGLEPTMHIAVAPKHTVFTVKLLKIHRFYNTVLDVIYKDTSCIQLREWLKVSH